ncbi:protein artichoke isoform X2 [Sitophilus oryzae]|uniref:Protein artichoke isoform X2 n=1 Tax=Sitophilus oryzae TaxID=7048 RepID=A0A6J2XSI7_SITOR|nr:protein artichoke isoform X2 [Sitophilus oryzae]
MTNLWIWSIFLVYCSLRTISGNETRKGCPPPKVILPCRCLVRGDEYQIWCTHSDLQSVLEGLRATAKFIQEPIDEVILENNYLPSLPGRTFFPLKILRLMLRHNGLERVSNDWLGGLETVLVELYVVEPRLRSIPDDSLLPMISLEAITIDGKLMKRVPLFSGLPKLKYLQIKSALLMEISPSNFKDNPSLEKLHIGPCPKLNRLDANLLRDLPSLRLVNISHSGVTLIHPMAITRLPILDELILIGNRISDAGMVGRVCRELPQLQMLRLDENYLDVLEDGAFVDLPMLTSLHLSNNRIRELQQGAFDRVPRLRNLNLSGNVLRRIHPDSFLPDSGNKLEELLLVDNKISHVADLRIILDALPRLVFLDMSYNNLEAIPFGSLRGHQTLEHLNLDYNNIHLIDREAFVAMPALRELRLKNNSLSNTLISPLWNLPQLKGLDLSGNAFRRLEHNFLSDLPSLRKLDFSRNELTFIDPASFAATPALEFVNISNNALANIHPSTFKHLMNLYELDISNNAITEFIPGLPHAIEYLHLQKNKIIVMPLNLDLPALKILDLTKNRIEFIPKGLFTRLPQLRKLYLGKNFLKKLEDGTLRGLSKLEALDLMENGLIHLGTYVFRDTSDLRDLNLGNNRLELINPELFHSITHLKRLNLTQNLINEILPGTMDKNNELQMIDVSSNKLVRLPSAFMGLKNLRILNINYNRLNSIDPEILGSLPSLRALKLAHNFIKELKEHVFHKLQHLSNIDLEENELEYIESNFVKNLPVLKQIKLCKNKIKNIPEMAFVNLPSLQILELQENQIKSIAPNAFVSIQHLLMLNLSHNQIENIEAAGLKGAKSLEMLDLSHNGIKAVVSPNLEKMEWLVELRLDNNKICGVNGSPFNNMPRLRVLSLKNNQLMSFPERVIERIRGNIAVLDIDGNPLACACNTLWLQAWLRETGSVGPKCGDGPLLRELDIPREECSEEERNVELVAPGCESELLSAPGLYGISQVSTQWMNLRNNNNSGNKNNIPPLPEESEYFYDDYVDYPDNGTGANVVDSNTARNVGGFIPILPGTGGFSPMTNIFSHQDLEGIRLKDPPPIQSNRLNLSTTSTEKRIEKKIHNQISTNIPTTNSIIDSNSTLSKKGSDSPLMISSTKELKAHQNTTDNLNLNPYNNTINLVVSTTTELLQEITTNPADETTVLKVINTKIPELAINTESSNSFKTDNDKPPRNSVPQAAFLIPGGQQPPKKMATITKVHSPVIATVNEPLISLQEETANYTIEYTTLKNNLTHNDMSWYFATYNNTKHGTYKNSGNHVTRMKNIPLIVILVTLKNLKSFFIVNI